MRSGVSTTMLLMYSPSTFERLAEICLIFSVIIIICFVYWFLREASKCQKINNTTFWDFQTKDGIIDPCSIHKTWYYIFIAYVLIILILGILYLYRAYFNALKDMSDQDIERYHNTTKTIAHVLLIITAPIWVSAITIGSILFLMMISKM
jgi:hypothetical protein